MISFVAAHFPLLVALCMGLFMIVLGTISILDAIQEP